MTTLLGCIADDATGGSDVALALAQNGMSAVQSLGIPEGEPPEADALVISLKTRTADPAKASELSTSAARYLLDHGARQLLFKYCSTFDSSERGNIGPVANALLELLGADFTIFCPALPGNGRTVLDGHLFVNGVPLSETGMRDHPLTPMTNSNLVKVLGRQAGENRVGLIPLAVVEAGIETFRTHCDNLRRAGRRYAIVDALTNDHLMTIGSACADLPLVTGSSGIAMALPENFRRAGLLSSRKQTPALPALGGAVAILSGSCSPTTRDQIEVARSSFPVISINAQALAVDTSHLDSVREKAFDAVTRHGSVLLTSSAEPQEVQRIQDSLGAATAGELVERALSSLASDLVRSGVRKLIVAGGETSGAVAESLGIRQLRMGPEIDPGVPWTIRTDAPEMLIAFKSGNFGSPDFFRKAVEMIP